MSDRFTYDVSEVTNFSNRLASSQVRISGRIGKTLKQMSDYTKRKMQLYTRFNSPQSTGRLRNSISIDYLISKDNASSEIYVPEDIKYQFAAEYGIRRRYTITGNPTMTFPAHIGRKLKD